MKRGDYAYMPGTGPADKYCKDCDDILVVSKQNGRCRKAAEMRHVSVLKLDTIPLLTQSCKFFDARKE